MKITVRTKLIKGDKSNLHLNFSPAVYDRVKKKKTRYEKTDYWIYNDFQSETEYYEDSNGKRQSRINIVKDRNGNPKKITLTAQQKQHNKEMRAKANAYMARRLLDITDSGIRTEDEIRQFELSENRLKSVKDYFYEKAINTTSSKGSWLASYRYFTTFYDDKIFQEIDKPLIEDFRSKLLGAKSLRSPSATIKTNSSASYFVKFVQMLEMAYDENYLSKNFKAHIKWIKEEEVQKEFLTLDECITLFETEFEDETLVKYSKFSFLTGLRYSDISNLKWSDLKKRSDNWFIDFKIKKTSAFQYHPISDEAFKLLGEYQDSDEKIFPRLKKHEMNRNLRKWLKKANINKKVTFHNFRTSYAVEQLNQGTDIYVISKMLGHKNVSTTEIYAKIVDDRKNETINRISLKR